jgi:hypothetical protein
MLRSSRAPKSEKTASIPHDLSSFLMHFVEKLDSHNKMIFCKLNTMYGASYSDWYNNVGSENCKPNLEDPIIKKIIYYKEHYVQKMQQWFADHKQELLAGIEDHVQEMQRWFAKYEHALSVETEVNELTAFVTELCDGQSLQSQDDLMYHYKLHLKSLDIKYRRVDLEIGLHLKTMSGAISGERAYIESPRYLEPLESLQYRLYNNLLGCVGESADFVQDIRASGKLYYSFNGVGAVELKKEKLENYLNSITDKQKFEFNMALDLYIESFEDWMVVKLKELEGIYVDEELAEIALYKARFEQLVANWFAEHSVELAKISPWNEFIANAQDGNSITLNSMHFTLLRDDRMFYKLHEPLLPRQISNLIALTHVRDGRKTMAEVESEFNDGKPLEIESLNDYEQRYINEYTMKFGAKTTDNPHAVVYAKVIDEFEIMDKRTKEQKNIDRYHKRIHTGKFTHELLNVFKDVVAALDINNKEIFYKIILMCYESDYDCRYSRVNDSLEVNTDVEKNNYYKNHYLHEMQNWLVEQREVIFAKIKDDIDLRKFFGELCDGHGLVAKEDNYLQKSLLHIIANLRNQYKRVRINAGVVANDWFRRISAKRKEIEFGNSAMQYVEPLESLQYRLYDNLLGCAGESMEAALDIRAREKTYDSFIIMGSSNVSPTGALKKFLGSISDDNVCKFNLVVDLYKESFEDWMVVKLNQQSGDDLVEKLAIIEQYKSKYEQALSKWFADNSAELSKIKPWDEFFSNSDNKSMPLIAKQLELIRLHTPSKRFIPREVSNNDAWIQVRYGYKTIKEAELELNYGEPIKVEALNDYEQRYVNEYNSRFVMQVLNVFKDVVAALDVNNKEIFYKIMLMCYESDYDCRHSRVNDSLEVNTDVEKNNYYRSYYLHKIQDWLAGQREMFFANIKNNADLQKFFGELCDGRSLVAKEDSYLQNGLSHLMVCLSNPYKRVRINVDMVAIISAERKEIEFGSSAVQYYIEPLESLQHRLYDNLLGCAGESMEAALDIRAREKTYDSFRNISSIESLKNFLKSIPDESLFKFHMAVDLYKESFEDWMVVKLNQQSGDNLAEELVRIEQLKSKYEQALSEWFADHSAELSKIKPWDEFFSNSDNKSMPLTAKQLELIRLYTPHERFMPRIFSNNDAWIQVRYGHKSIKKAEQELNDGEPIKVEALNDYEQRYLDGYNIRFEPQAAKLEFR